MTESAAPTKTLHVLAAGAYDDRGETIARDTVVEQDGDTYRTVTSRRTVVTLDADVRELGEGVRVLVAHLADGDQHVISDSLTHPHGFGGVRDLFNATVTALRWMDHIAALELSTVGKAMADEFVPGPATDAWKRDRFGRWARVQA